MNAMTHPDDLAPPSRPGLDKLTFRRALSACGLTMEEFANMVGLSYTTVRLWGGHDRFPGWVLPFLGAVRGLRRHDDENAKLRAELEEYRSGKRGAG